MKQWLVKLYWWAYVVRLSFRWIRRTNLGDYVWHKGRKLIAIQGVANPYWDLSGGKPKVYLKYIHKSQFRKSWTPRNMWHSFKHGYRFYMTTWFDIWVREGIKPWMRGCKIWATGKQ